MTGESPVSIVNTLAANHITSSRWQCTYPRVAQFYLCQRMLVVRMSVESARSDKDETKEENEKVAQAVRICLKRNSGMTWVWAAELSGGKRERERD